MKRLFLVRVVLIGVMVSSLLLVAVRAAEPEDKTPRSAQAFVPKLSEPRQEVSTELETPLVEDAAKLTRLNAKEPVWVDKQNKQVVLVGAVCKRQGPLELFACLVGTKEYESIVTVQTTAHLVQTALLAAGAEPGAPVQYEPKFAPPHGTQVDVTVVWNDKEGHRRSAKAQEWVRKVGTTESMEHSWVFTGGRFWKDPESGKETFTADLTGDLISVANFDDSVLDVPMRSTTNDANLAFEGFVERIPERGTPVTLILKPVREKK